MRLHRRESHRAAGASSGDFDSSRYFRGTDDPGFYNVGTSRVRAMAKQIYRTHRDTWSVPEAQA